MILTKKTITTWPHDWEQLDPSLMELRNSFVAHAEEQSLTDSRFTKTNLTTTERFWKDQTAAEAWKTFIVQAATDCNLPTPSVEIVDIEPSDPI